LRWNDLLADLDVQERRGDAPTGVTSITHDSRHAGAGSCFACIAGAHYDGHDFAPDAVRGGAVALLVERLLEPEVLGAPVAQARVADVRAALGPMAATLFSHPSRAMRCIGVTGTNGKTTTTYLLEAIARAAGERVGVIGTVGARVGTDQLATSRTTPEADELQALLASMRDEHVATVAMEVSSHALAQHRVDATWFAAACFTNLSHEHLDYHGTLDAYFEAKAMLFDPARAAAAAVNVDDPYGVRLDALARVRGLDVWTFGAEVHDPGPAVRAEDVTLDRSGSTFVLVDTRRAQRAETRTALIGSFNVANALAAAASALAAGFGFDDVVAGLRAPVVVPGRMERVDAGQGFDVIVDYAHTPDALDRVLGAARDVAGAGRVLVVFGCGGDRDRAKRPIMGAAAGRAADVVVLTSDNPRSEAPEAIADEVMPGLAPTTAQAVVELDREQAIALALDRAGPGDVVVVAGKGHETGQTVGDVTRPFDDRVVAREVLARLGWS
jgi:UDP-N-acetylmuramoyl-L-alanyl-D-glutamate--2,6-diaminopimelate ligase